MTASSILYTLRSTKKMNFYKDQKRLLQMATLTSALTLPRLLLTHLLFWIGYNDDEEDQTCEIVMDISVVAYVLTFMMVYLFLWMRQHYIYKQPSIASINTKTIRVLSWACFTYIIIISICVIFLFVKDAGHRSTLIGCYTRRNVTNVNETTSFNGYYFSSAGLVLAQISVFALLVYPLIRHWNLQVLHTKIQTSSDTNSVAVTKHFSSIDKIEVSGTSTNYATTSQITNGNTMTKQVLKEKTNKQFRSKSCEMLSKQRLQQIIKRNAACALGCIISDLSVQIMNGAVIKGTQPRYFTGTLLDVSLLVNIVFFFLSFNSFKKIFCFLF